MGRALARRQPGAKRRIIDTLGGSLPLGRRGDAEGVAVESTDAIHPVGGEHALLDADEGEGTAGAHHGSHGAAGIGIEAGGEIHRQHWHLQAIDCCDDLCH